MSVHKRTEKQSDGTVKVTWRSITRDQNGKRIFRTFPTRAEAVRHDQDAPAVYKMLKRAETEDQSLDDVIDFSVERGDFARRAPIEKALDKIDKKRLDQIGKLVQRYLTDCEQGAHGRNPRRSSTVSTYRNRMAHFTKFFEGRSVGSISKDDMRKYRDHLVALCKTREAARSTYSMASIFFNYLIDDLDMRLRNPCKGVTVDLEPSVRQGWLQKNH